MQDFLYADFHGTVSFACFLVKLHFRQFFCILNRPRLPHAFPWKTVPSSRTRSAGSLIRSPFRAVIHATFQKSPTTIGNNVSIGHNAIVHGCTIHDNVLIGMGSIVMDDCVVESNSIIAAGAVVTKNTRIESGSIYAGIPARKVKDISAELISGEIHRIAENYVMYSAWFKEE